MSGHAFCAILIGLLSLGCGPAAPRAETDGSSSPIEARLAEKRKQLAQGTPVRSAGAPERRRVAPPEVLPSATPPPERAVVAKADPLPAHLPRRERLTRACYRDTFAAVDPARGQFLLPRQREFCRCMVDTVFSTGVAASLQDALIEDFERNREVVEAANEQFNVRWQRCRM